MSQQQQMQEDVERQKAVLSDDMGMLLRRQKLYELRMMNGLLQREIEFMRQRQQTLKEQDGQEETEERRKENEMMVQEMEHINQEICRVQDEMARLEGTSMEPTPDS